MNLDHGFPDLTPEEQAEWDSLTEALEDARTACADAPRGTPAWASAHEIEALAIKQRSRFCMRHHQRRGLRSMSFLRARTYREDR